MHPLIQLKTATPLILLALACFGLLPKTQAVIPPPDGGYPGNNTAEGHDALFSLTTGVSNTAVGFDALYYNNTGNQNTATGFASLFKNTAGMFNTADGFRALYSNTIGHDNTANGVQALFSNTTGIYNTASGVNALYANTSGSQNTATGVAALKGNKTGERNTANGYQALFHNTTGSGNTGSGYQALFSNQTGANNAAFGYNALSSGGTNNFYNTAVGWEALSHNTVMGYNTAVGAGALAANDAGFQNTAIGINTLVSNTAGNNNTAIGYNAGTAITGSGNVCIGQGVNGIGGVNDTTWILNVYASGANGRAVYVNSDNKIGTLSSSRRYKDEIRPMAKASEAILCVRPVSFRYKKQVDPTRSLSFGLIAEEVAQIDPDLVTPDRDGKPETVRYDAVNAMLLNEFLKEHRKVQELEANAARQQKQIEALTLGLQRVSAQLEASKPAPQVVNNP